MQCKFLVFLLIVFFFFSFFLSALEFRFIERIGAHGKTKSRFYHYYLLTQPYGNFIRVTVHNVREKFCRKYHG